MTRAQFDKLARQAQAQPCAEAMQIWPFVWGVFTLVFMSVFSKSAFAEVNGQTHAYLGGIALNLTAAALLAGLVCWAFFKLRSSQRQSAVRCLRAEISELNTAKDAR